METEITDKGYDVKGGKAFLNLPCLSCTTQQQSRNNRIQKCILSALLLVPSEGCLHGLSSEKLGLMKCSCPRSRRRWERSQGFNALIPCVDTSAGCLILASLKTVLSRSALHVGFGSPLCPPPFKTIRLGGQLIPSWYTCYSVLSFFFARIFHSTLQLV